jgi:tRNA pseudouridine38-40 synthase
MRRIKLTVAYDGTAFHGWQYQPNQRTIEGEVNLALSELIGEEIKVIGASRTDAGVHAYGNVAVFDTDCRIPGAKFAYALNSRLPSDIKIMSSEEVAPDFHPRYDCHNKTYEYHISTSLFMLPTKRLYATNVHCNLDVEKMNEAAKTFVGRHDFASFQAVGSTVEDTVRTIFFINVRKTEDEIVISVNGDGFLYNMVRIIAGTLINVGNGRLDSKDCQRILDGKDRTLAGPTAPACGLFLKEINYD